MTIAGFSTDEFGLRLSKVVFPSRPVTSIEYLKGRDDELEIIKRALYQPGRHIFIYGDRGVGKSSLGQTAAVQYQTSEASPIFVSGSIDDTFRTIIANIANIGLGRSKLETTKQTQNYGFEWRGLRWCEGKEISALEIASQIQSIGDATELLKQVAERHSEHPIVVVDEFDSIQDVQERNKFASLLKQLGDQSVNLKFIFTGIGKTLDDLLGAHPSAYRQLETLELSRLSWEGRRDIVNNAVEAFNLTVNDAVNWRIAMVSDGFPYYVQLITEKMLWEALSDPEPIDEVESKHFQLGLRRAVESINAELKRPYEQAVIHRDEIYQSIVWSTADGEDLSRNLKDMYESYKVILRKAHSQEQPISAIKFNEHIRKLKTKGFGYILESIDKRPGWYMYKEKMLRGYVRMQAEANGVELTGEREAPRQASHISSNVKTGYRGPTIPHGVRLSGERKHK